MTYKNKPKHFILTQVGIRSHAIELAVQVAVITKPKTEPEFFDLVKRIFDYMLAPDDAQDDKTG